MPSRIADYSKTVQTGQYLSPEQMNVITSLRESITESTEGDRLTLLDTLSDLTHNENGDSPDLEYILDSIGQISAFDTTMDQRSEMMEIMHAVAGSSQLSGDDISRYMSSD